jgi:hypothetical protein
VSNHTKLTLNAKAGKNVKKIKIWRTKLMDLNMGWTNTINAAKLKD